VSRVPPKLKTKFHQNNKPREGSRTEDNVQSVPSSPQVSSGTSPECSKEESQLKKQPVGNDTKKESPIEMKLSNSTSVPEVVEAVDTIANYFGTSSPGRSDGTKKPEQARKTLDEKNTTSLLSTDKITDKKGTERPGPSKEDSASTSTTSTKSSNEAIGVPLKGITKYTEKKEFEKGAMPSYAPEKCTSYPKGFESTSLNQMANVGEASSTVSGEGDVSKLSDALVTKRDIFGSQPEKVVVRSPESSVITSSVTTAVTESPVNLGKKSVESDKDVNAGQQGTDSSNEWTETLPTSSAVLNDVIDILNTDECDDKGGSDDGVVVHEGSSRSSVSGDSAIIPIDDSPVDWGENEFDVNPSDSECSKGSGDGLYQLSSVPSMEANTVEQQERQPSKERQPSEERNLEIIRNEDETLLQPLIMSKEGYSKEDQIIMEQFQKIATMENEPSELVKFCSV